MTKSFRYVLALAVVPVAAANAQIPLASTDGGSLWQISCTRLDLSGPTCPTAGYTNAIRVTASPSGWATPPLGPNTDAYYISPTATGSIWANTPDETENYQYIFRTAFVAPVGGGLGQVTLNGLWLDNYWGGWSTNGVDWNLTGITPTPGYNVGDNNWNKAFQLNFDANFAGGSNYLYFKLLGNGRTDALLAWGEVEFADDPQNVVPEPATMTLLATGLAGMAAARRRRRTA